MIYICPLAKICTVNCYCSHRELHEKKPGYNNKAGYCEVSCIYYPSRDTKCIPAKFIEKEEFEI